MCMGAQHDKYIDKYIARRTANIHNAMSLLKLIEFSFVRFLDRTHHRSPLHPRLLLRRSTRREIRAAQTKCVAVRSLWSPNAHGGVLTPRKIEGYPPSRHSGDGRNFGWQPRTATHIGECQRERTGYACRGVLVSSQLRSKDNELPLHRATPRPRRRDRHRFHYCGRSYGVIVQRLSQEYKSLRHERPDIRAESQFGFVSLEIGTSRRCHVARIESVPKGTRPGEVVVPTRERRRGGGGCAAEKDPL